MKIKTMFVNAQSIDDTNRKESEINMDKSKRKSTE
jgi:hypothetical protein